MMICDPLCNLLAFVQFKKREKHPSWRSVKSNTLTWVLLSFLHCTNCTKSRRTSDARLHPSLGDHDPRLTSEKSI